MRLFQRLVLVTLLFTSIVGAGAQGSDVTVSFLPGVSVPLGPMVDGDLVAYSMC